MGDRSVGIAGIEVSGAAPEGYRAALAEFAAARNWVLDGHGRPGRDIQGDTILLDVVQAENPRSGATQWGFAAFRASGADEGRECVRLDIKEAVEGRMLRLRAERAAGAAHEVRAEAEASPSLGR